MGKRTAVWGSAMAVVLVAGLASAQTTGSTGYQHWTVDSAQTIGDGANVLRGQVGWPGLWLDFIHGLDPTFDIGGRLSLNWGDPDGSFNAYCVSAGIFGSVCGGSRVGMEFQLLLRKQIAEIGGFKLALTFNPGFLFFFSDTSVANPGIAFPIGAQMGFPINEKLVANASFELPFWATFGTGGTFYIPILFGGGVEYMLQPDLLLTFKLAMGPSIPTCSGCGASFALDGLAGVAYKMK
jgi:hypothetical protein